ncbi:MAG: OsmC family protein [Solirubrobacteraceae bacterium]|jgi:uncharacterized OsmC-like protein|nr:OsmC family protein [Solirubrobacteraceae bacterium]
MHNVNTDALRATHAAAQADPASARQAVRFDGSWQVEEGAPQFVTEIPLPDGSSVSFAADFPPPMGGRGQAPNPLAYCFWGGLACYAMSFAQEAALAGVELRSLRATVTTDFNMGYALGVGEDPPVERLDWELDVDADASPEQLEELKAAADAHCPGAYCIRNPVELRTSLAG